MATFEISDIVRVTSEVRAGGVPLEDFGRTLFLTQDDTLDAAGPGKVKVYARMAEVEDDFPTTSEPFYAGQAYFAQKPYPKNLLIGRWTRAPADTVLLGGPPAQIDALRAVSTGSFVVGGVTFTGLDQTEPNLSLIHI